MAIRRIDPKATFKVVSPTYDEAIDSENSPSIIDEEMKKNQEKLIAEKPELADQFKDPGKKLKYMDTLDLADLKIVEGKTPTYFVIKNLLVQRKTELMAKHVLVDTSGKNSQMSNMMLLFIELFKECCTHIEDGGQLIKVSVDEFPAEIVQEIGSIIFNRSAADAKTKNA